MALQAICEDFMHFYIRNSLGELAVAELLELLFRSQDRFPLVILRPWVRIGGVRPSAGAGAFPRGGGGGRCRGLRAGGLGKRRRGRDSSRILQPM